MSWRGALKAAAISALLLAVAPSSAATAASHPAKTYTVVIEKMNFGAVPSKLRVGDAIIWINRDLFRHTVTAADHSFDIDLVPGKSGKITLHKTGIIAFSCKFHPGMRGHLVVAP